MARKTRRSSSKARRATRKTSSFARRASSSRRRTSAPRRTAKRVSRTAARPQTIRLVLEQAPAAPTVGDAPSAIAQALASIAANRASAVKPQKAKF